MNIESLSDVPLFAARPVRRSPPKQKAAGWMIVGLVNLLVFNLFVFSQNWPSLIQHGSPNETTIDLTGMSPSPEPNRQQVILPEAPSGAPPEIVTEPIIIPPPVVQVQPQEERGGITQGDILGAIGREVACSAGNFENLTTVQRSRCARIPWSGAIDPNGTIVLRIPPPRGRFFEEENARAPEVRITGNDANLNRVQGADTGCPVILNTPCFNRIPGRN